MIITCIYVSVMLRSVTAHVGRQLMVTLRNVAHCTSSADCRSTIDIVHDN